MGVLSNAGYGEGKFPVSVYSDVVYGVRITFIENGVDKGNETADGY